MKNLKYYFKHKINQLVKMCNRRNRNQEKNIWAKKQDITIEEDTVPDLQGEGKTSTNTKMLKETAYKQSELDTPLQIFLDLCLHPSVRNNIVFRII